MSDERPEDQPEDTEEMLEAPVIVSDEAAPIEESDEAPEQETNEDADYTVAFRVIDGACPALECELPAHADLTARPASFLAKSPVIEIASSAMTAFECYQNGGEEAELLYLTPQEVGSFMTFDLSVHRHGLILLSDCLFAWDRHTEAKLVLDVEIGEQSKRPYQLYQVAGAGKLIAFMRGDLFPLTLQDGDKQQVQADMLAAIEPSVSFELAQLENGEYVASLAGPGRIWLQSKVAGAVMSAKTVAPKQNKSSGFLFAKKS